MQTKRKIIWPRADWLLKEVVVHLAGCMDWALHI